MPRPNGEAPSASGTQARYSIQLISFREPASLVRFAREQGLIGEARTLNRTNRAQSWHPVLIGTYPTRDAAQAALKALPAGLQSLEPIVRSLPRGTPLTPIEAIEERKPSP
jgi:septal ring-binding cell division protein DamX